MSELPGKAEFEAQVGSEFSMELDDGVVTTVVLKRCDTRTDTPMQECFSLIFVAPVDAPPVQMVRRLRHNVLGEMSIFVVPIKLDDQGLRYEAVFNRLKA